MPDSSTSRDPVERLAESVVGRLRAGQLPDPADYAARYPELASQVASLLPALVELEQNASVDAPHDGAPHVQAPRDLPQQLGDYTLVREIGRGGMGVVYEAVQESLGRHVAIKIFQAGLSGPSLERFRREAKAAARLHHGNIVPVYGVGESGGVHFYVMQFIRGRSVNVVIEELRQLRGTLAGGLVEAAAGNGFVPAARSGEWSSSASGSTFYRGVARVGLQVADALDYAHSHGVLHRDIKPSNLLLDAHGTAWVTDFGLAKSEGTHDLTETGDVVGTLNYMPPERLDGRSDPRADVYGLGATLYELLALCPPYQAAARTKLIEKILHAPPPPLRKYDPAVPRDLETIICKALAKEPGDRYAAAREMAEDLRLFLSDRTIRSRRTTTAERLWRWRRRNPALASITTALVLVFALGFAGVTWKWREAERARQSAQVARNDADRRAAEIQQAHVRLQEASSLVDVGTQFSEGRGWDDADHAFTAAISLRPELAAGWEQRGELYFRLGLFDLAAADLQHAFELKEPINHRQWRRLALLRLHTGDVAGYRIVADRMAQYFRGTVHGEAATDLVRTLALVDDVGGDASKWAGLAEKMALTSGHERQFQYVLGAVCYRAGQFDRAVPHLRGAPSASPADDLSRPILAMAYQRLGQFDAARSTLDEATKVRERWLDQIGANAPGLWIVDQGAKGEWPIAYTDWLEFDHYFRQAGALLGVPVAGDDARVEIRRARAFAGLRRREMADNEYADALRFQPDNAALTREAHRNRGYLRLESGRYEEAAAEFDRAMGPDRSDCDLWRFVAVSQCAAGDFRSYQETCADMVNRFGTAADRRTLFTVVWTCTLHPDALADMNRLISAGEDAARWWIDSDRALVGLYYRLGRYDEALQALGRHSRFAVAHPGVRLFAAMAHYRLGRRDEARLLLADAVAAMTASDDPLALRALVGGSDPRDLSEKISEKLLQKEAEALILGAPPSPAVPTYQGD